MHGVITQARAIVWLVTRQWLRGPLLHARARHDGRRVSGVALRALTLVASLALGVFYGSQAARNASDMSGAGAWVSVAVLMLSGAVGAAPTGPGMRGVVHPLFAPMLDALPMREWLRLAGVVLQNIALHVLAIGVVFGFVRPGGVAHACVVGLALSVCATLLGIALLRVLRVTLSPVNISRVWSLVVVLAAGPAIGVLSLAGPLSTWSRTRPMTTSLRPIGRVVVGQGDAITGWAMIAVGMGIAAVVIRSAERAGYDRVAAVPTKRPKPVEARALTLDRVDVVMTRREPMRWASWFLRGYPLMFGGIAVAASVLDAEPLPHELVCGLLAVSVLMVTFAALTHAQRTAAREVAARPLLAPLPIAPNDLLRGKARALQKPTLLGMIPMLALLASRGGFATHADIAARLTMTGVGLWFACDAIVSITFLTSGVGARADLRSRGASVALEWLLVLVPLLQIATAPLWSIIIPVACLCLLAREARVGARASIRWLDDGDPFERETPVWRALMAFAGFEAFQALAGQLLAYAPLPPLIHVAIAYAISAAALVLLTFNERRGSSALAFTPERARYFLFALVGGTLSGSFATGYRFVLERFKLIDDATTPTDGRALLGLAVIIAAPLAEEIFFRGWFQPAIESQYSTRGRNFAIAVTAFAFAAIHPPLSFAPVLVLGLVTGWLASRGRALAPAIIAHMIHNAFAVSGGF